MRICYVIIKVDDQQKALFFYTSVVGFVKKPRMSNWCLSPTTFHQRGRLRRRY
jgi:hypothetical protein